jgi:hypothetical protein
MKKKHTFMVTAIAFVVFLKLQASVITVMGQGQGQGQQPAQVLNTAPIDSTRSLSKHFIPATSAKKAPDEKGFIQRWLVLEPIKKEISSNNILTDSYINTTFSSTNFSTDFNVLPQNGEIVKVGDKELKWYALDSKYFTFKLFSFAYAIKKPQNGVVFWVVTVINCPEEVKNVRLSAGCNSAGMFWLNGKEAVTLSGNRDMVVDNCTSQRLTLKKGKNIIRGAVINGQGIIDFSVRFLDENLKPFKNFTISCE